MKIYLNPPALKNCKLSQNSKVCSKSELLNTTLDDYSYIGYNCFVAETKIGKYCSIADNCRIGGAAHPLNWVTTSPVFHNNKNVLKTNFGHLPYEPFSKTIIENDVWLGANVLIKSGIKISNGAVIGMGSVVTHDVGPYEIWAGNPAKLIRKRFSEENIEKLLKIEWWNLSENRLRNLSDKISDVEKFIKEIENENFTYR
uniref:CatB-related O-acetyltransferase n=1 Tax=Streptococcus uberis TaxID=1349 RepID=UPI0027DBBEEE|nr:CatB-related O-acetyltransferase [Streptococcus uberis]